MDISRENSHTTQLTAPLASIEDLSRVNTPGGSPSPRPKMRHPALSDPNWEPPEDPNYNTAGSGKALELTPLHPKTREESEEKELPSKYEGPPDRLVSQWMRWYIIEWCSVF